ncbi:MAG TPA: nucleoside monophosphate kinase [Candidatus Chromulinivoraceae bacterium]|nr:nucleoside monophosphate kinase [Candidatus Chromulinivoraceae bacterium]
MIVFFGPAGAGKSVQGQMLAARNGWRWLSSGQLLRDTRDIELIKEMQTGRLVTPEKVNELMVDALKRAKKVDHVILDGYPRQLSQAKWLIESQKQYDRSIQLVVVLEVPKSELLKRIEVRGRVDDTPEAVDERLRIYRTEIYPILTFLTEQGVNVAHIDGTGTVGQVHDRIMDELAAHQLV